MFIAKWMNGRWTINRQKCRSEVRRLQNMLDQTDLTPVSDHLDLLAARSSRLSTSFNVSLSSSKGVSPLQVFGKYHAKNMTDPKTTMAHLRLTLERRRSPNSLLSHHQHRLSPRSLHGTVAIQSPQRCHPSSKSVSPETQLRSPESGPCISSHFLYFRPKSECLPPVSSHD